MLAAQVVPMTFLVLVAGVWADRMSRRRLMLVSDLGRAAVQAVLAVLLLTDSAQLWHLLVLCAAYGALEAFFRPAAGGLTPSLVPADELQQANALVGLAQNAGHVIGPAAAGALIVVLSPGAAIAVDAATFVVSAVFLVLLREPAARAAPRAHAALLGRAQGRHRRGPAAPLDARLHAAVHRLPLHRAALRARPRRRAGRPRARRRGQLGDHHLQLRRGHDRSARSSGCAGSRRTRCWRRRSPSSAPAASRRSSRSPAPPPRSRPSRRSPASPSRSASRSGRRRSAA